MLRRALLCLLLFGACDDGWIVVDEPFRLGYFEDPGQVALFRCPNGGEHGCAIDGLPGPVVFAAGADKRYVVAAQHPDGDRSITHYYYVVRLPDDNCCWHDQKIVGPMDERAYRDAKSKLSLPDFTVTLNHLR